MKKCRLCLTECFQYSDVSETREGFPLSIIAMVICPIRIESDDKLPKIICEECVEVLLASYKLREISNKSDRYLRESPAPSETDHLEFQEREPENYLNQLQDLEDEELEEKIPSDEDFDNNDLEKDNILFCEESTEDENLIEFNASSIIELDPNFPYIVDCKHFRTKKSAVWSYIGLLAKDNGELIESQKDYYYCKICVEQLQTLKPKYKAESVATSVLFSHLEKIHGLNKSDMTENTNFNQSHQVSELVICGMCNKTFNSGSINIHVALEHENKRKRNSQSQQKVNCFKTSSKSLAWEYFGILVDSNDTPLDEYHFYCRICVEEEGKLSPKYTKHTSTSILLQHLKNAHVPKSFEVEQRKLPEPIFYGQQTIKRLKTDDFECNVCEEKFDSKKLLNRHLEKEHNRELSRNFKCDFENCGKSFTIRDTLQKHKGIHEERKFPCDRCPTVLSTKMSLKRHIESCHLKLKMFTCSTCGANYSEQKSLKNHMQKVHLGIVEKKVPCDLCDLTFQNLWSLRRHLLSHTKEKPHQCHLCTASYASKGDLSKHITRTHGDSVYKCSFVGCDAGFRLKNDLRDHYKIHYDGQETNNLEEEFEIISEEFVD